MLIRWRLLNFLISYFVVESYDLHIPKGKTDSVLKKSFPGFFSWKSEKHGLRFSSFFNHVSFPKNGGTSMYRYIRPLKIVFQRSANGGARIILLLSLVFTVSCGGGGGGGAPSVSNEVAHSAIALGTIKVPAGSTGWITAPSSPAKPGKAFLPQGGGIVNQIVFNSDRAIYIDGIRVGDITFYEYDGSTMSGLIFPIPFWHHYLYLWRVDSFTQSAILPTLHTIQVAFPSGDYEFKISNSEDSEATVNIYQAQKTDPDFSTGKLDINLLVYTTGEANEVIPNEAEAQNIKTYLNEVFSQVGIKIGTLSVEFRNDPSALATLTDAASIEPFLRVASAGTVGRSGVGINCFLVPSLPENILGMGGAIPGPAIQGMTASGIVAQAASFSFSVPGMTPHEFDQRYLANILAHEIGHYLGLYHTSESAGKLHSPLTDTPICGVDNDKDKDGKVTASECQGKGADYLMFWSSSFGLISKGKFEALMSEQEGQVANTHPSVL